MKNEKDLNKQQYAYVTIRARILDGTYSPGFRLVINQLAKEFSTSAIPVREAIRQLEAEGLIDYKPYSGAVVTPIDENQYHETLSVLAVLEGYATADSSQQIPEEKLKELKKLNQSMRETFEEDYDFIHFGKLNRQFHSIIYDYCTNSYLAESIRQIWHRLDSIRHVGSLLVPKRVKESINEHDNIIKLMETKESLDKIEQVVREHKMNTLTSFNQRKKNMYFYDA
ncbi:GntR family transcriptional regulator [Scopulibacillus cellulosilyticus]|uniref:GntR family transcriptional regulator n=1 Tax=Scopulibacillus cellulosilyticus TaxID=2665665 RepID=A0ABW2PVK1_9BACL